jgi:hypothetical protein
MRTKSPSPKVPAERVLKDIRRVTRKHYSAEDKIRIVLEGLRGEDSIAWKLCTTMKAADVTDCTPSEPMRQNWGFS